ncbi:hypothetical protein CDL15_Pgr014658 [Punica granatum]|uniref:SBP-type domain-containing protein n=1 Tax=Punica granatum TaxID=22663 RepID=A0A218Y0G5_PUNGR|nr:hypothetical protein CDL15_Pgr014658 [Punica granatum]
MESSWIYVSEGKGFGSNSESISPPDSLSRSRNPFPNGELVKTPSCFGNHILISGGQPPADMGQRCFGPELGIQQMIAKQLPSDSGSDVLTGRFGGGRDMTPIMASLNAFSEEDDSTSKFSSSVVDSNSRDSSLIDLKLERFNDIRDHHSSKFSRRGPVLSYPESSAPSKRGRAGGISSQTAYCQVYGCNKDLSSSKDYHKRHKVCEAHSKTAKVIVNGIEQRFCQQCSRFHLLAEFDDGKRSCRKRLAGHNERRRKPQVGAHSGRSGRLLQPFGNRFQGNAFAPTSFICQDILPNGTNLNPEKYSTHDLYGRIKLEDRADYGGPLTAIPLPSRHLHSKSPISPYTNLEKQFPFAHETGVSSSTSTGIFSGQISASRSFFQDSTLGSEDFSAFNSASALQGFSESGCALSLLSSPSQNSSSYSLNQVSNKIMSEVPNKLRTSSAIRSGEGNQTSPILISGCADTVNFEISEGILRAPEVLHEKGKLSCDDGPTISLSQLSSQLHRVEHQRRSMKVKREDDPFFCTRLT